MLLQVLADAEGVAQAAHEFLLALREHGRMLRVYSGEICVAQGVAAVANETLTRGKIYVFEQGAVEHIPLRVGMVSGGEDKNGSRFYIVTTPTDRDISAKLDEMRGAGWREEVINVYSQIGGAPSFDYRYTVFGQVYEGLDIAYEIANSKTDESGKPQKDIKIESVTVYTVQSGDETSTGE